MDSYKNSQTKVVRANSDLYDHPLQLENVEAAFSDIRTKGEYLAAWDGEHIPWPRYTANIDNTFGVQNHFQGIQRLRKSNYLVISGGDPHESMSHLFVVKMASRQVEGGWRSNTIATGRPPNGDEVVRTIGIDSAMWHAGGINILGDILAVPVYNTAPANCRIVFFHLQDPENPQRFRVTIERPGMKAGAVALTKLRNGYYLVAVWSDSDAWPRRLDFYLSRTQNINDGFRSNSTTWEASAINAANGHRATFDNFQNINFVPRSDGRLFLVGMHNTSDKAPTIPGKDYADLYEIEFPEDTIEKLNNPELAMPTITKVANKQFFCNDQQANMDGAAGIYVDPAGFLRVYSAYHWRSDSIIKFNEYRPVPDAVKPKITDTREAWVDLYEHDNFSGRCLSLRGKKFTSFRNYSRISVHGGAFNDKVSSARFQLPPGEVYRLFEHRNFEGSHFDLQGTGAIAEIRNFHTLNFGDRVSSSRFVV